MTDPTYEGPKQPVDQTILTSEQQIELAARVQSKWLRRMDWLLDHGLVTSTDMATLARVLLQNGWSLDPARLPKGLRDKLTAHIPVDDFEDEDVAGHIGKKVS